MRKGQKRWDVFFLVIIFFISIKIRITRRKMRKEHKIWKIRYYIWLGQYTDPRWVVRFPDLSPLDFFLGTFQIKCVQRSTVRSIEELETFYKFYK